MQMIYVLWCFVCDIRHLPNLRLSRRVTSTAPVKSYGRLGGREENPKNKVNYCGLFTHMDWLCPQ